jgi:hypothetical protein
MSDIVTSSEIILSGSDDGRAQLQLLSLWTFINFNTLDCGKGQEV